tara:strand:- start:1064 stop:1252 length:189 start_codon:yes stop_codon:yes gene_type:complete
MVVVYFERSGYANIVAMFDDEEMYDACSPVIDKLAGKDGFTVTESCEIPDSLDNLSSKIERE